MRRSKAVVAVSLGGGVCGGTGGVVARTEGTGGVVVCTEGAGGVVVCTEGAGGVVARTEGTGGVVARTEGTGGVVVCTEGTGGVVARTEGTKRARTAAWSSVGCGVRMLGFNSIASSAPPQRRLRCAKMRCRRLAETPQDCNFTQAGAGVEASGRCMRERLQAGARERVSGRCRSEGLWQVHEREAPGRCTRERLQARCRSGGLWQVHVVNAATTDNASPAETKMSLVDTFAMWTPLQCGHLCNGASQHIHNRTCKGGRDRTCQRGRERVCHNALAAGAAAVAGCPPAAACVAHT
eukprot:364427-Chlamydomonas_euryale.AAC.4